MKDPRPKSKRRKPWSKLSRSYKAQLIYKKLAKGKKLGGGGRFKALTRALKAKGAKNPKALAAWIGRKKYGKTRFQKLSVRGRKRK